jgi:hypothetical protein
MDVHVRDIGCKYRVQTSVIVIVPFETVEARARKFRYMDTWGALLTLIQSGSRSDSTRAVHTDSTRAVHTDSTAPSPSPTASCCIWIRRAVLLRPLIE